MKILVASDIHGSAYFCKKLLDRINEEKPDKVLLLGDILYHGPRNDLPKEYNPKEVINMLNPLKNVIMCVGGNCDATVDQMVLEFPVLAEYIMLSLDNILIYATHGHKYNKTNPLPCAKGAVVLYGHTHVPVYEKVEDYIYMNPGSISIPKENSDHSYMIIEKGIFIWKNVETGVAVRREALFND